jgi:hypothetical protein
MKYPIILLAVATVMLLVGVGIRVHADGKYTNKMFYHTAESALYGFDEVFAERKLGNSVQFWSVITGVAAGCWFVAVKIIRERNPR